MPLWVILVLLGTVLVGAALIALGRRGRRVNDHPQCTWCGFDLIGVYPGSVTCPECGAGLARKHGPATVRMGVRVRRPVMIGVGVVGVLMPLLPLGLIGYAALTGTAVAKHLPVGGLELMATHGTQARADEAAVELTDRLLKKSLDAPGITRAVDLVLRYQADAKRPWTRAWADLLERVQLSGVLTAEQDQLIVKQGIGPVVARGRDRLARNAMATLEVSAGPARLATNQSLPLRFKARDWRIDDKLLPVADILESRNGVVVTNTRQFAWVGGSGLLRFEGPSTRPPISPQLSSAGRPSFLISKAIPAETPVGRATVKFEVDITGFGVDGPATSRTITIVDSSAVNEQVMNASDVVPGDVSIALPVEIVDDPDAVVDAKRLEGEALAKFAQSIRPEQVVFEVSDVFFLANGSMASGTVRGTGRRAIRINVTLNAPLNEFSRLEERPLELPDGTAFDVEVRVDDQVIRAGSVSSRRESNFDGLEFPALDAPDVMIPKSKTATVRLIPSRRVAQSVLGMNWYHDGELEFKDVPISIVDSRNEKLESLVGLRDSRAKVRSGRPQPPASNE